MCLLLLQKHSRKAERGRLRRPRSRHPRRSLRRRRRCHTVNDQIDRKYYRQSFQDSVVKVFHNGSPFLNPEPPRGA